MKIRSISISNYRSFAASRNPEIIRCSDDVNIIIGKNGSGKSNIGNALRLAFGRRPDHNYHGDRLVFERHDYHVKGEIRFGVTTDEGKLELPIIPYHENGWNDSIVDEDPRFFPIGPTRELWKLVTPRGNEKNWSLLQGCWEQMRVDAGLHFNINLSTQIPKNREAFLKDVYDRSANHSVPVLEKGSGYFHVLYFLFEILKQEETCEIYLLEEPETHMHPELQRQFLKYLTHLAIRGKQFFVLTHSSVFIDECVLNQSAHSIIRVHKVGGASVAESIQRSSKSLQSLVFEELGYRHSDVLGINGIIWVEGPSDRLYLLKWLQLFTHRYPWKRTWREYSHFAIIPYNGNLEPYNFFNKSFIPNDYTKEQTEVLLDATKLNSNYFLIMDRDTGGMEDWDAPRWRNKRTLQDQLGRNNVWITDKMAIVRSKGKERSTIEGYLPLSLRSRFKGRDKRKFAASATQSLDETVFDNNELDLEKKIDILHRKIASWNHSNSDAVRSKMFARILNHMRNNKVEEPFSVRDFSPILDRSPSFLSKHRKGNPGHYKEYFVQEGRGRYRINERYISTRYL